MSATAASPRPSTAGSKSDENNVSESTAAAWLPVVAEKVKSMRYGVIQIVVHDSKVVQIERTERTRFEVPQSTNGR